MAAASTRDAPANTGTMTSFPQVAMADVIDTLRDIGLLWITAEDINKPTQQTAHRVFSMWLEALSGVNQEWLERRKQEIVQGREYSEMYEEFLTWRLFYGEVAKLMHASQAHDFAAHDILHPQAKRFKRHLSALINFWRFREERTHEFDEFVGETEHLFKAKAELEAAKDAAMVEIDAIKTQREHEAPRAAEIHEENQRLAEKLQALKKDQGQLVKVVDELKDAKDHLVATHNELTMQIHSVNEQNRKLQSRIVISPKELKEALETLSVDLTEIKSHLGETERKAKSFESRVSVIRAIEEDLIACQSLLVSLTSDQHRLEASQRELQTLETDFEGASSAYSQGSQSLSGGSRQLENGEKRLERMRRTLEDKRALRKKREEDWARNWEEVNSQRRERKAELARKQREARDMEREVESVLRQYDAEVAGMIKRRNDLVKLAESYMDAIAARLDWDGQGLVLDIDAEEDGELGESAMDR